MYCNKCGKPLRGGDQRFCPECGGPVPLPNPQLAPSRSSSALADPKVLVLIACGVLTVIAFATLHGFSAVLALVLIVIAGFAIFRRGIKLEIKLAGLVLGLLIVLVSNGIEGWQESKSQEKDQQHVTKEASAEKHSDASSPLDHWYRTAKRATWASIAEVKQTFNTADFVAPYIVFDIGGNKYRLIAEIHFNRRVLFIRGIMTHKEYMKGAWRK